MQDWGKDLRVWSVESHAASTQGETREANCCWPVVQMHSVSIEEQTVMFSAACAKHGSCKSC